MADDYKEFIKTAIDAARLAGGIIKNSLGSLKRRDIKEKSASDFVTRIDRESEVVITDLIKSRFPDHSIAAEESNEGKGNGRYRWIIDPLDGTTNFIHGYPVFSVSIGLEHDGAMIAGVVFDPMRDEMFHAVKGGGAYLNGNAIKVSSCADTGGCLIATGFPFRRREMLDVYLKAFKGILLKVSDLRRAGSAAIDLAYVAAGRCDGFFELGLSPWDVAAGSIIIEEAGGIVTDFGGGRDYIKTGNIVAAAQREVHSVLLSEVKNAFGEIIDK